MQDELPSLEERLKSVDKELHSIINELKVRMPKKQTLSELNRIMEKDRIVGEDTTKMIREMRDKEYNL